MSASESSRQPDDLSQLDRADRICDAYERAWLQESQPDLETFLSQVPAQERPRLRRELELIKSDYEQRQQDTLQTPAPHHGTPPSPRRSRRHAEVLSRVGRYRIEALLGQGGFGRVYLAEDERLRRRVAVKVPHAELVSQADHLAAYLAEARTVANLDHPHIVPVYDVGATQQFPCYVVSKYVDGCNLATQIETDRPSVDESVELVAAVAKALHYAHLHGIVHRDVKPGNILIDDGGTPYLVDFGLALQEADIGSGPKYVGTPAYMSPEQAGGEGHRVDARSDIFSLGVVLYELLARRRPFPATTRAELLCQLTASEAPPLPQQDHRIAKELDRICQKALARRASERYSTAQEMGDDLRQLVAANPPLMQSGTWPAETASNETSSLTSAGAAGDDQPVSIVPKGLRSFDGHDADFFLELLPGPRNCEGLPDSLRFWKDRIEETDAEKTFAVGLIYGPSGCGKSSLVKAGLLPRLSDEVMPYYIEATADETEARLLRGLRARFPAVRDLGTLKETLMALRQGHGVPVDKKVLIIIDQFEQYLHANNQEDNGLTALRQCDGGRLQCILMVRDDLWMPVVGFMRELDFRLLDGQNAAAVDLFPVRHAEKVLACFGRAFGVLPSDAGDIPKASRDFITQAVADLAEQGKVISVRLSLFAEMMKGKPWTPASLKRIGGAAGVGVTFLEETFSLRTSHPNHRRHERTARQVLGALLPESGTDIKGQMKSYDELLDASGYGGRRDDFDDLIRILDHELRLITPTDLGEAALEGDSVASTEIGQKCYQLSHDYLVDSLRDWLTRKQQETRRGRAELRLAERSTFWNCTPENRHLPSWSEHAAIRLLTDKKHWKPTQRKMMSKAGRVHSRRTALVMLLLAGIVVSCVSLRNAFRAQRIQAESQALEREQATRARELVQSLLKAEVTQVPSVISDMDGRREWADPLLKSKFAEAPPHSAQKLHLALALLPVDDRQVDYLGEQLATATLSQFSVVRDALKPQSDQVADALWMVATDKQRDATQRFQAAAALATFAADDDRWSETAPFVARHLTSAISAVYFGQWLQHFRPASHHLTTSLEEIAFDSDASDQQRATAALALADYWARASDKLIDLILVAEEPSLFAAIVDALRPYSADVKPRLVAAAHAAMSADGNVEQRDADWRRQSLAAVTLVHLGYGDDVWELLRFTADPSLRSAFIQRLGRFNVDPNVLASRLELETDVSIRRALLQSLGGLHTADMPTSRRHRIVEKLQTAYAADADPGVHSAAWWALRQWDAPVPPLPPIGEANLTADDQRKLAELSWEVDDLRERKEIYLREELPLQQLAWERQLREQPVELPKFLSDGLIVHFPFDEAQGAQAHNTVKGEPHGGYRGNGRPEWVPGVVGGALRLDGRGELAGAGPLPLETAEAFSYGCWVYHEGRLPAVLLSGRNVQPYEGFDLSLERGRRLQAIVAGESQDESEQRRKVYTGHFIQVQTTNALMSASKPSWHHVLVTYDGSRKAKGVSIYVDGERAHTVTLRDALKGPIHWRGSPLIVGSRYGRYRTQGCVDNVRIYRRCLPSNEVKRIYELGIEALARSRTARTSEQQSLLRGYHRTVDVGLRRLQRRMIAAESALREERLARQFGAAETAIRRGPWVDGRRWYINSQGQTMVVFRNPDESSAIRPKHGFAISNCEVTFQEYRRFVAEPGMDAAIAPTADCPAHVVSWFQAAAYCNWLSEQEGIPRDQWVYELNEEGEYGHGMRIKQNYWELIGYRLPTGAEWEHACRAGASATYSFGEPVPLLQEYAQYVSNSGGRSHPVGSLLPNDAGMFDMHGNVWEWTLDPTVDELSPVRADKSRVLRGGAFYLAAAIVRPGSRTDYTPAMQITNIGFRPARTFHSPW